MRIRTISILILAGAAVSPASPAAVTPSAQSAARAAAGAGPPWSPPQTLSSPRLFVDRPALTFGGDGSALASWVTGDGTVHGASRPPGADRFGAERRLARSRDHVLGPRAYGRRRALLATVHGGRIAARFGTTAGAFGAPRAIATGRRHVASPALAAAASGAAAVAWFENLGVATDRVYVALRRPGRGFGAPLRLATGAIRRVAVTVGPRGQVLVAWSDKRGRIRVRTRPAGARRFRRADRLAALPALAPELSLSVGRGGRATLAAGSQARSEGGDVGPARFQAAVRPAGARRFRAAQRLETRDRGMVEPIRMIAATAARRSLVAWTGFDGTRHRARAAATGAGARFGPAQDLSDPGRDAWIGDLAARPGGRALAVWTAGAGDELAGQVQAALAPRGAPFGPPEAVSADEEARIPAAAFDPATGRPAVIWSNRPAGSTPPIRTFAQLSLR